MRFHPLLFVLLVVTGVSARASEATLVAVRGAVLLDGASARPATPLHAGQVLATGPTSEATLLLPDGSIFTVRPGSRMRLSRLLLAGGARDVRVDLEGGGVLSEVSPSRLTNGKFEVGTPVAVAGVRGTSFNSDFNGSEASFDVFAGRVEVASPTGSFRPMELGAGERINATSAGRISHGAARSDRAPTQNRPALAPEGNLPQGGGPGGQGGPGGPGGPDGQGGPGGQGAPGGQQGPGGQGGPGGQQGPGGAGMGGPGGPGGPSGQGPMGPGGPGGPGGGPSGGMMQPRPGGMPGGGTPGGVMAPPMHIGPPMMPPPQLAVPPTVQPPPQ